MPAVGLGQIKPVTYTYRPYFIPAKNNKRVEVIQSADSSPKRVVNIWYGVTVQMSFEGSIVAFSFAQLLTGLCTGLVLLSSATTLVVYLALYVFQHKDKYLLQMYQYTEDMSDYKALNHSKGDLVTTSFTGNKLFGARGKGDENATLSLKDVTDILVDYEVRLNRLDGRDPKLAFIDGAPKEGHSLHKFHGLHARHTKAYFDGATSGQGSGLEVRPAE
jgi:hypothetical protein